MLIQKKTVFILGAGASEPYGFPLGLGLRNAVSASLEQAATKRLLRDLGHSEDHVERFRRELRYSGLLSVDVFLEKNPAFLEIGKEAIAACLLPFEGEDRLFPPGCPNEHWYEFLAGHMRAGTDDWNANALSIVTFNYDRSLEHYLTRVIAQRRQLSAERAFEEVQRIPIIHLHGSLGGYPAGATDGLDYGAAVTATVIRRATQRVLVVSEAADTLPTFEQAVTKLREADRIYFLGFGFHPDNVRRLQLFRPREGIIVKPMVAGTTMGFSSRDWAQTSTNVLHSWWTGKQYQGSVYNFLRHEAQLD